MLVCVWVEFESNESTSQPESGTARGKRSSKWVQNEITHIGTVIDELFNERFGQLIVVADLARFVFSGQDLHTESVVV